MRRTWSLATLPAVALLAGSSPARAALVDIPTGHASVAAARTLTGLALVPGADGAELVIGVSGPVEVHDFAIASPHRIVLDLGEARLGAARLAYDGTARGGVTNVRVAQNRADVVRIVVDLDAAYPYAVTRDAGSVRVTIRGEARFAA